MDSLAVPLDHVACSAPELCIQTDGVIPEGPPGASRL